MNGSSKREIEDRKLFNEIGKEYVRKDIYLPSRVARKHRLLRTLEVSDVKRCCSILELGCGGGFSAQYLEGFFNSYTGIDYSETLIEYAKEHNKLPKVSYIVDNIRTFSPKEHYDVIIMIGVLHHIDEVEKVMRRMIFWLNPGGVLISNEPHHCNPFITIAREIRKHIDNSYSPDQAEFKLEEITRLYHDAGFNEIKVIPQGVLSTIFAEVMIGPGIITLVLSRLCCWIDRCIERLPAKLILPLSWNVITVGRRP